MYPLYHFYTLTVTDQVLFQFLSRLKLMQELWEMDGGHKLERDGKWSNLLGADGGERTYSDSRCQSGRLSSAKKSSRSSFRQQPMMSSGFEVDRVEVHHPTDHRRSSSRKIKVEKSRKSRKKDQKRKSKSKGENEVNMFS